MRSIFRVWNASSGSLAPAQSSIHFMNGSSVKHSDDELLKVSSGFQSWLLENRCSLAFSSFERGRLFFVGLRDDGQLWVHERFLENCRGLFINANQIWLSTFNQMWNFHNVLPKGVAFRENGSDRLYCPRTGFVTGAVNIHEIELDRDGRAVFVNTQYSCLAVPDLNASFKPLWKPDFVTDLVPEERCHLNGMAMENGVVRFVTARARCNDAEVWKNQRHGGGILVSVGDNEIVSSDLSMPHSPRLHNGDLWLLNTGTCEFGSVDLMTGKFVPMCQVPGYARGLAFIGNWAVIGVSRSRYDDGFKKLPLKGVLQERNEQPQCGLMIVDLKTGCVAHRLNFQHTMKEISNVSIIPEVRQATMLAFSNQEQISGFITLPNA